MVGRVMSRSRTPSGETLLHFHSISEASSKCFFSPSTSMNFGAKKNLSQTCSQSPVVLDSTSNSIDHSRPLGVLQQALSGFST